jgi:hypothetical protein
MLQETIRVVKMIKDRKTNGLFKLMAFWLISYAGTTCIIFTTTSYCKKEDDAFVYPHETERQKIYSVVQ